MKHSILLLLTLSLFACKKDSDNNDQPSSSAEFYFVGKIDDQLLRIELTPTNDIELSTSNGGSIGAPHCTFDYGAYIAPIDPSQNPQAEVNFAEYFNGDCGDESAVFNTLFPTGNQVFLNESVGGKGAEIHFVDDSGNYSSARGPQTSGQFVITKSEVANDPFGLGQSVSGTVSCTLYDEFGGKKELTEGSFRLHFRPWF